MTNRYQRQLLLAVFLLISPFTAFTQSVPQISIFPELTGNQLLDSLHAHYKPEVVLSYDNARDFMFGEMYYEDGWVRCVYTGDLVAINPDSSLAPRTQANNNVVIVGSDTISTPFNTEHIWPQSRGALSGRARADLHHLQPIRGDVNTSRSNFPFAYVDPEDTNTWWKDDMQQSEIPDGDLNEWSRTASSPSRFEVRDYQKGNVARSMLYFYAIYKHKADAVDPDYFMLQREVFKQYHDSDPVDLQEYDRSMMIADVQDGKANPFILDTTLVRRAFFENYDHELGFAHTEGFIADFESYSSDDKGSYADAVITITGLAWLLDQALIGTANNDKKTGMRSLRIRRTDTTPGLAEMQDYIPEGASELTFDYAHFGNDLDTPNLTVAYNTTADDEWTEITTITSFPDDLTTFSTVLNIDDPVRFRFITDSSGDTDNRINIDNMVVLPFDLDEEEQEGPPQLYSVSTVSKSGTSLTLQSSVIAQGGSFVSDRGFVISPTNQNNQPEIGGANATQITAGSGIGTYSATAAGLQPDTEYSVRSYAENLEGVAYSSVYRFSTLPVNSDFINQYQQHFENFRDLGENLTTFGMDGEWSFTATEADYNGGWGSGTSAGFRGGDISDPVLGYQHTSASGTITISLTLTNTHHTDLDQLYIHYTGRAERTHLNRFPEWTVSVNGEPIPELSYSTQEGDNITKNVHLTDVGILPDDEFTISWSSDRGDGDDAALQIGISDVQITRLDTVTKNVTGTAGWYMFSPPFRDVTVQDLAAQNLVQGISGANDFYGGDPVHDQASSNLYYISDGIWLVPENLNSSLSSGKGYFWYLFDNDKAPSIPIDEFSLTATRKATFSDVFVGLDGSDDFVLTGNPFTETLTFDDASQWGDIQSGVTIWNSDVQHYEVLTGPEINIPVWTAFWVEKAPDYDDQSEIRIPYAATEIAAKKSDTPALNPLAVSLQLETQLTDGSVYTDGKIQLRLHPKATHGWDAYDMSKLSPPVEQYTQLGFKGKRGDHTVLKAVESRPLNLKEPISVPLSISGTDTKGKVTVGWDLPKNAEHFDFYLEDLINGRRYNMSDHGDMTVDLQNQSKQDTGAPQLKLHVIPESHIELVSEKEIPQQLALHQNYPNPFNPTTNIRFDLPETSHTIIEIFDVLGRRVSLLINEELPAGFHDVRFDGSRYTSGLYFIRLKAGNKQLIRSMTLLK